MRPLLLLALTLAAASASAQLPPDARWYTFETPHFRVHFHDGLDSLALAAAARAETARAALAETLLPPPRGRVDLVVTDHLDLSNGWATPFPTNRVALYAHPPTDVPTLAFFDDWLALLVTHELTHTVHLDQAGGLFRAGRSVFGRAPFLFPHAATPTWFVEGLATVYESELTGAGRVRGTHHAMILRTALLEGAFLTLDEATGVPVAWPAGQVPYVYGAHFLHYLADTHGLERLGAFVRRVGAQVVPYRLDAAARATFGVSFAEAWAAWERDLLARTEALAAALRAEGLTEPELLTAAGGSADFPRFADDGLVYMAVTGRDEPTLRRIGPDGVDRPLARISTTSPPSQADGAWIATQLDYTDPYRLRADLVRLTPTRERLTRGARLVSADVHPDGHRAVAVQTEAGTTRLVLVDLATGAVEPLVPAEADVHWSLPRWAPEGERLAVARWRRGGFFDVVVLDAGGAVVETLVADRAVNHTPAWSPDGRYVLFSSDRTGVANLFAYDLREGALRQVTNVLTGAFQPDVSPDGRWIAFSLYRADGYRIARIPFDPTTWRDAPPLRAAVAQMPPYEPPPPAEVSPVRRYRPGPSAAPTAWIPWMDLGTGLGAGFGGLTYGWDVVERHAWEASALVYPAGPRVDARLNYRYRGFGNPVVSATVAQGWSALQPRGFVVGGDTIVTERLQRERLAALGATFQHRRWHRLAWLGLGVDASDRAFAWADDRVEALAPAGAAPLDLGVQAALGLSTQRAYRLSISPEDGFTARLTASARHYTEPLAGRDAAEGYGRLVGSVQAFRGIEAGGPARHVLALRVAAGLETGPLGPGFGVGGDSAEGVTVPFVGDFFGGRRTFPVRGYAAGAQRGDRAAVATLEYRLPLFGVERGVRTWPVFLGRVWGAGFVDAGAAWCTATCARFPARPAAPEPLASVGAELSVGVRLGYFTDVILRGGVAVPLRGVPVEGAGRSAPRPAFYLTTGRAF